MMKFREILLKKFVQTRDETDWCNFKQSRDRVKKMLRDAENNYTCLLYTSDAADE